MRNLSADFLANESGAVTTDWVFLGATVVAMIFAVLTVISQGAEVAAGELNDTLIELGPGARP